MSSPPSRPARPPRENGQAAVELVALLPLAVVVLLLVWQVALVGHGAWSASTAARAAARAHAVGGDELRAARAALPPSLEHGLRLLEHAPRDGVALRVRIPAVLPGLPTPSVTARSTFAEQR